MMNYSRIVLLLGSTGIILVLVGIKKTKTVYDHCVSVFGGDGDEVLKLV